MEYQTQENRIKVPTNPGTEKIDIYSEAIDKDGRVYLKKIEETNIYQKIQASLEETQTYNILEKFLQSGDASIINKREGIYGNFTNIPNTPIELQNTIMRAEREFEELDKDVRAEFENNVGMFKQSILDGTFNDKMSKYLEKKTYKSQQSENQEPQKVETTQTTGVNLNE